MTSSLLEDLRSLPDRVSSVLLMRDTQTGLWLVAIKRPGKPGYTHTRQADIVDALEVAVAQFKSEPAATAVEMDIDELV